MKIEEVKFDELIKELNVQDERSTNNPIFLVYDYDKVPTCSDYTNDWEYVDVENNRIGNMKDDIISYCKLNGVRLPDEDVLKVLDNEELFDWLKDEGFNVINKVYYIKKRVLKGVFFTNKSSQKFIKENIHHFSNEVHVYVDSLWKNDEMVMIRNFFKNGMKQKV